MPRNAFPRRKSAQLLLVSAQLLGTLPENVQQYVRQYFKKKCIGGIEYYFAFTCPHYEEGTKGAAPKSTPKMVSDGTLSWLMKKLAEDNQSEVISLEASWIKS